MSPGKNEYRLWCCIDGVPVHLFSVIVAKSDTVDDLKQAIKKTTTPQLDDTPAFSLDLFKVSIGGEELHSRSEDIRHPEGIEGSIKLENPIARLSQIFSVGPEPERINIIVRLPDSQPIPRKRRRVENDGDNEAWDIPMRLLSRYVESAVQIRQSIMQETLDDPTVYSDPSRILSLPFPSVHRTPRCFNIADNRSFSYMGRERFAEVWETLETIKSQPYHQAMYIYGTTGYGKSHILAALMCLLIRRNERAVYIPKCAEGFEAPVTFMRKAFLLAFADSLTDTKDILSWTSTEHVLQFCENYSEKGHLVFVVDQLNALDTQHGNDDADRCREGFSKLLRAASASHIKIHSTSANVKFTKQKQTNDPRISLMGGMSETEMNHWWSNHEDEFKAFSPLEKVKVKDLTGCIPLYLSRFLNNHGKSLASLEPDIWGDELLSGVDTEVRAFADMQQSELPSELFDQYQRLMADCLTNRCTDDNRRLMDCRWFYIDSEKRGRCTCGLAREAMITFLARASRGSMRGNITHSYEWLDVLAHFKNNAPILGSIAKHRIIAGFTSKSLRLAEPDSMRICGGWIFTFDGTCPFISTQSETQIQTACYVPQRSYYTGVDFIHVHIDKKKKVATVVAAQITIAKEHSDSEQKFFEVVWPLLEEELDGFEIDVSFLWITGGPISFSREGQQPAMPEHALHCVTIDRVDEQLAATLAKIYPDGVQTVVRSQRSEGTGEVMTQETSKKELSSDTATTKN